MDVVIYSDNRTQNDAIKEFVEATLASPLHLLPSQLAAFPNQWPFPRGDLYHWIAVLNRFDDILALFTEEYGLSKGPQTQPFGRLLLLRGDGDKCKQVKAQPPPTEDALNKLGLPEDGDRVLIESILKFTGTLLDNAGNRSLYSSSPHLSCLLNITSLSLLKETLMLLLRLAKRYNASKQRFASSNFMRERELMENHYNVDIESVRKIAAAFIKGSPASGSTVTSGKGKGKAGTRLSSSSTLPEETIAPTDLVSIVKSIGDGELEWPDWAHVSMAAYQTSQKSVPPADSPPNTDEPSSPSPRRSSTSHQPARPSRLSHSEDFSSNTSSVQSKTEAAVEAADRTAPVIIIEQESLCNEPATTILKMIMPLVQPDMRYELLHKIRVAQAMAAGPQTRQDIVAIRILAIANLAYVDNDQQFQQDITTTDSQEPRRLQLAYQLAELVHPPEKAGFGTSKELQAIALWALEALTRQKTRANEVYTALSANVNHGILFFLVRKMVSQLAIEDGGPDDKIEEEWREALYSLLSSLPGAAPRAGEAMISAGLFNVLVDVLTLRTSKAERNHWKIVQFLDVFVYATRDAFQSLANARGLDLMADLTSYTVFNSYERARAGDGMPKKYKTQITDYQIPFYQQLTLRWLFKFLNHSMTQNGATLHRQLRNLIDSPKLLEALRQVLSHASVYGSNVWSGVVNILSNFIHNEPTSYAVIAEARLNDAFIEAVSTNGTEPTDNPRPGVLPAGEAIQALPTAFGAICLNENGLKQFQDSNALESFFYIFENPEHVKGIDTDVSDIPTILGSGFDELVRHHPALKARVLDSVVSMVSKVAQLCSKRASEDGVGAKLWFTGEDGKLHVAGGHKALCGDQDIPKTSRSAKQPDVNGDIDMLQSEIEESEHEESNDRTINQVLETEDVRKGPSVPQYISVVSRFLAGFFNNKSCCQAFIDLGGLESLLDLATLPSLPFNFEGGAHFGDELFTTIRSVLEEKPYLAVPAVMKRLYSALEVLKPMLETTSETAFFSPFTSPEINSPGLHNDTANGTAYAKALVNVRSLGTALSMTFQTQTFSNRSQSNIFSQVNLTDMYIRLIDGLGHLHRSCLWEEILLQNKIPSKWEAQTRIANISFGDDEADQIFRLTTHDRIQEPGTLNQGRSTTPLGSPDPPSRPQNGSSPVSEPDQSSAQYKNIRIVRFLLSQVSTSIAPLFSSLGRNLLLRRVMDPYQKSNAFKVADQLAKSALDELRFDRVKNAPAVQDRYRYLVLSLSTLNRLIMDESYERSTPQTLTLVLSAFKQQGGFTLLEDLLDAFADEVNMVVDRNKLKFPTENERSALRLAEGGLKLILQFYSRVINSRHVNDAIQTQAMTSGSRSTDKEKPDFFSPAQFLVEVRFAVIRPVMKIWDSSLIERGATTLIVKDLIDILRLELDGESEQGAFTRSDKISPRRKATPRKWALKAVEVFNDLRNQYDNELAREAMYRCYEHRATATEYCQYHTTNERSTRNPIPPDDQPTTTALPQRPESSNMNEPSAEATSAASAEPARSESPNLLVDIGDSDDEGLSRLALAQFSRRYLDAENAARDASPAPSRDDLVEAEKLPDIVTVDDLNEERNKLRANLIDRCLEILSVHDDVTFELSDLITAATGNNDQNTIRRQGIDAFNVRQDIGTALVQALLSMQIDDVPKEEFLAEAKTISSYAHLLALVIQDKAFYEAIQEQLTDSFEALVGFVKISEQSGSESDGGLWIPHILLILERLLSDDAQPRSIVFDFPSADDPIQDNKPIKLGDEEIHVGVTEKTELFKAILKILPKVGKNDSLALSVSRILVILTRNRDLAISLGEKANLRSLFTMIKQIGDFTNERLQSSFMNLLRHIVEDDETVRQIMRTEITAMFEGRAQRAIDTTTYTRTLHHLVIRNPAIFVEITNETLRLSRYEPKHGPQNLALKKDLLTDSDSKANGDTNHEKDASEAAEGSKAGPESAATEKPTLERTKTADLKMPVIENPDGVIHFLISELLNYKDVEDPKDNGEPRKDSSTGDIEMSNGDSSSEATTRENEQKPEGKEMFKTDKHPLFVYRCILLQCLTELLSCYNRTKIEFINYKRRADSQVTTPSKPRSFVLNYLLNNLIPQGTISHDDSVAGKKRMQTSTWAIAVINALCSKTTERGYNKSARDLNEYEEDPELLYVRKFVLEHALRAFKEAQASTEPLDYKYSRLMGLSLLFERMLQPRRSIVPTSSHLTTNIFEAPQKMLSRIMYEKNFISSLTSAIADIDLNFPNAKRAVKYVLKPLRLLASDAVELSLQSDITMALGSGDEDEISSASSDGDIGDVREETPDLFRNSALGILDPRHDGDEEESSSENDDDEDMEYDEFGDEMDYEEEMPEHDPDDIVSDEEEEIDGGMGPIEGLPGEMAMEMVVSTGPGEDYDDDDDENDEDLEAEEEEDLEEDEEGSDADMEGEEMPEGSAGADDEDWTEEEDGEEYPGQDEIEDGHGPGSFGDIVRALGGSGPQTLIDRLENGAEFEVGEDPEEFIGDDLADEDDEDGEEDFEAEQLDYQPNMDDEDEIADFAAQRWGAWDDQPRGLSHHLGHRHGFGHGWPLRSHWGMFGGPGEVRSRTGQARSDNDGTNPLLQRQGHTGSRSSSRRRGEASMNDWVTALEPGRPRLLGDSPVAFISNLINMMTHGGPPFAAGGFSVQINGLPLGTHHLAQITSPAGFDSLLRVMDRGHRTRPERVSSNTSRDDPAQATRFDPASTSTRWKEEASLLFGSAGANEKAQRVINDILRLLVPPARETQKREAEKAEQVRKEREAVQKAKEEAEKKEREEREAREKKEREEREAAEREAAEARARAEEEAGQAAGNDHEGDESMEGIETAEPAESEVPEAAGPSEPTERIVTTLRGRQVDITELGIDLEYLEALPEDVREEVVLGQIAERRSQANRSGDAPTNLPTDFLDQLPPDIREELLAQEATDRRQHEREEARRRAAAGGGPSMAEDMDPASFFATLDPQLRNQILAEADDETLTHLDPSLAAEARALGGGRSLHHIVDLPGLGRSRGRDLDRVDRHEEQAPRKSRPVVQILDKAGVATLLRLMFIPPQNSIKSLLDHILQDVCNNRQNRAEVVSILLSILQDGSSDVHAVERSFTHLSLRAKQPAASKTPQTKRPSPELGSPNSEMSPVMVVQQCLSTLTYLAQRNRSIQEFFLKEHETVSGLKSKAARKSKGKEKESKASKYPLNALLGLLDRKLIIDSSPIMEQLASLLQFITLPLTSLQKKKEEKAEEEKKDETPAQSAEAAISTDAPATAPTESADVDMTTSTTLEPPSAEQPAAESTAEGSAPAEEKKDDKGQDKLKKPRVLESPPEVPEHNLRLVVNIVAARECNSKTFKDTLSLITHLSAIPEAKEIFGQELILQAQELGHSILHDLELLVTQITDAETGTDVQGMALARFSPASSDQAKLLRVMTALDWLFDPKPQGFTSAKPVDGMESGTKAEILMTLYQNETFAALWKKLSECLTAIRERGNMFNVATILMPLIEVLMVVCKNTTLKEAPLSKALAVEFHASTPPPDRPEAKMEDLFFNFTEEHRKILNDLVRHNPKLMSGSFSVLVKNSKVLEFDNKRNYFHRKLHSRGTEVRQPHPSLQLSVRRDQVFLDSFKSLYYKKADEFKYGKLNIRFSGEEGVDAGGVTREWFQVLAKQMFDPNYALFNPVASDRTTFHPNSHSAVNPEHLTFFKFIGRVIGKALYESRVLDCHFSRAVYKRMLGKPVSIKDMETLDLDYYKSVVWMLENDITDIITETFSVEDEVFGETKIVDLIPDGRNVQVTEENKHEYVRLVVEYKMIGAVKEQLDHFLIGKSHASHFAFENNLLTLLPGFHDIIPAELISIFNEQELELLISGLPEIDVDDWKNNTDYHNYQAASPQIQWFWRAVRSFDKEERAKLLQFVTGTSKVPLNGFKELEGMNGFTRFNIHRDYGSKDRLPSSHTCFNQLDLPEYESYEQLRKALYTAFTAGSEYFGFA